MEVCSRGHSTYSLRTPGITQVLLSRTLCGHHARSSVGCRLLDGLPSAKRSNWDSPIHQLRTISVVRVHRVGLGRDGHVRSWGPSPDRTRTDQGHPLAWKTTRDLRLDPGTETNGLPSRCDMAPPHLRSVTPDQVQGLLCSCLFGGCRGSELLKSADGIVLVDLFFPAELFPTWSDVDRAARVESLQVEACDNLGPPPGEAARSVLGIRPGMYRHPLADRRENAASYAHCGNSGEAFRRRHEKDILLDVSFELLRLASAIAFPDHDRQLQLAV